MIADSDFDGIGDGEEISNKSNPLDWNDPVIVDGDGDQIEDEEELLVVHHKSLDFTQK